MRDTDIVRRGKRRRFTKEYRRQVVEETLVPGASIAGVALKHRLNANLVFTWRRRLLPALAPARARAVKLLPVTVTEAAAPEPAARERTEQAGAPVSDTRGDRGRARRGAPGAEGCGRCRGAAGGALGAGLAMIALPTGTRVWVAAGVTDMRKGMDGLAALVQTALAENPFLCGEAEYVAAEREYVPRLLWAWSLCSRPATHKIYTLSRRLRTASLGRNRWVTVPRIAALSRPRRIISTSAAAYRCVVATCACPSHA